MWVKWRDCEISALEIVGAEEAAVPNTSVAIHFVEERDSLGRDSVLALPHGEIRAPLRTVSD